MRVLGLLGLCAAFVLGGCIVRSSSEPPLEGSIPTPRTLGPVLTTGSRDVSTMEASMSAQSDGKELKVFAALLSNFQFLKTDDGDYFTARVGGDTVVLTPEPNAGSVIHYTATFPVQDGPVDVVIAFVRRNGKTGAPYSTVRVPAPFTITSAPTTIKSGEAITLTTSVLDPSTTVDLDGACIELRRAVPNFMGTEFSIYAGELIPKSSAGCSIAVNVRHQSQGEIDSAFRRGFSPWVEGLQVRSVSVRLLSK